MKIDEKRFHQYSLSFYQKETQLKSVTSRVRLGFSHFEKNQKLLKPKTIQMFGKFNEQGKHGQKQLLDSDPDGYIEALFDIVRTLGSDRDLMEYILPTIDAILTEERTVLRQVVTDIKAGKYPNLFSSLRFFFSVQDQRQVTYLAAARVACIILGELPKQQFYNQQKNFLLQLLQIKKNSIRQKISDYGLASCFIHLNKHSELAELFIQNGGVGLILDCLNKNGNDIQLIYYALLNVWMVSFTEIGVEKFISLPKHCVIKLMCEILQKVSRQKITRISFIIFKNIQNSNQCLQLMMDNKLLKIIDTILKGNIKDQQLIGSIKEIGSILESNIRVLSSFDKYAKEIASDMLEWSSVHNQRFWKENALKFAANDYHMIKKLKLLLNSKRSLNVAIACYDLGQFCRFYPRGKDLIETFQIKDLIMEKARYSEDKAVREQALLALQKIMIQNWQSI